MTAPATPPGAAAPKLLIPWLLLLGGASIYGSIFAANKFVVEAGVPFIAYTFWQSAIAAVLLLALSAATGSRPHDSTFFASYSCDSAWAVAQPADSPGHLFNGVAMLKRAA